MIEWNVVLKRKAVKAIDKLDSTTQKRIKSFIKDLKHRENPRQYGRALTGGFKGLWRYRVGDYRLICQIKNNEVTILVLEIGHRKEVYK